MAHKKKTALEKACGRALREKILKDSDCKKEGVRRIAQDMLIGDVVTRVQARFPSTLTIRELVNECVDHLEIARAIQHAGQRVSANKRRKNTRRADRHVVNNGLHAHRNLRFAVPPRR